eukprot:4214157-Pleurochrysis_carterae.AAC.1
MRVSLAFCASRSKRQVARFGVLAGELRRVVAIDARSTVHTFRWPPPPGRAPPIASSRRLCSTQLPVSDASKSACTALLCGGDGGRGVAVVTGGHWDGARAKRTRRGCSRFGFGLSCVRIRHLPSR